MEIGLKSNRVALLVPHQTANFDGKELYIVFQPLRWVAVVVDNTKVIGFEEYEYRIQSDEDWNDQIKEWENFAYFFKFKYQKVVFCYLSVNQMIFPKNFLEIPQDVERVAPFFDLSFEKINWILSPLPLIASEVLTPVPAALCEGLRRLFATTENLQNVPSTEVFLKQISQQNDYQIALLISDLLIGVIAFVNGKMKAINYFNYYIEDDIYYHVFNFCNQLGVPYQKSKLQVIYQTSTFLKITTFFQDYFIEVRENDFLKIGTDACIPPALIKNNQFLFMLASL